MFIKTLIFACLLCTFGFQTAAKTYSFKHFTVEDGLPSSEVYDVIQDNEGFMWFATDRGLVRFDGYEFETYTTVDGLSDNVIFHLREDNKGHIWFACFNNTLGYIENDSIHAYQFNDSVQGLFKGEIILDFQVTGSTILIGASNSGLISINSQGNIQDLSTEGRYSFFYKEDKLVRYKKTSSQPLSEIENTYYTHLNISSKNNTVQKFKIPIQENSIRNYPDLRDLVKIKSSIYFCIGPFLLLFDGQSLKCLYQFTDKISDLTAQQNTLMVSVRDHGIYHWNHDQKKITNYIKIPGVTISNVYLSEDDVLFLTTHTSGVFMAQNTSKTLVNPENTVHHNIYNIVGHQHKLLISDRENNFYWYFPKNDSTEKQKTPDHCAGYDSGSKYFSSNNTFAFGNNCYTNLIGSGKPTYVEIVKPSYLIFERDTFFSFHEQSFAQEPRIEKHGNYVIKMIPVINKKGVRKVVCIDNQFLFCSIDGIYKFEAPKNRLVHLKSKDDLFETRTIDIIDHPKFDFIAATRGEGVLFVKNEKPYPLKKRDGLLSDEITALAVDSKKTVWVGTSQGISLVDSGFHITNLRTEDGLISNEVTAIAIDGNKAFIGTKKGLTILNTETISKSNFDIPVRFKQIELERRNLFIPPNNQIHVDYNTPYISINFVGISYRSMGRVKYRYRLNPNERWQYTKNTSLLFSNLASGEYILEIQASNGENEWSKHPAVLMISVAYPFWQTWPFIISITLAFILLLFFAFRYSLKRIKRRSDLKQQIQTLRYEALNAQMNPHFMFNSLNSIQNFIMQNEKKASIRYLAKFAKLMRMTLHHSQSHNITLREELDALELYLTLETLRFGHQFDYSITVDENLDIDKALIPALLIQPIVENAILHGIRPLEKQGHISIRLSKKLNQLIIEIEDNGVGRARERRDQSLLKSDGHQSKGSLMTKERVALFANEFNGKYLFNIIDLKSNNLPLGTRVVIEIPLIF